MAELSFDDIPTAKEGEKTKELSFEDIPKGEPAKPKYTGYWQTQQNLARQGVEEMGAGISTLMHPGQGYYRGTEPYYVGKGLGQLASGAIQHIGSPLFALPNLGGQIVERATGGYVPRQYPEFALSLLGPAELGGFTRWPRLVEEAWAARQAPAAVPGFERTISRAGEAAQRQGLDIPRAVTSESAPARIASQAIAPIPYLGAPLREAVQKTPQQIAQRVEDIASEWGVEQPRNITGGGIEQTLGEAAKAESAQAAAAKEARDVAAKEEIDRQNISAQEEIDRRNAAAQEAWQREHQERAGDIQGREAASEQNARATFGEGTSPTVAATQTMGEVRQAHNAEKAEQKAAWDKVEKVDAPVSKRFSDNMHGDMEQGLREENVTLSDKTPNANAMMAEIEKLSSEAPKPAERPVPKPGTDPNVFARNLANMERVYGEGNIPDEAINSIGGIPGKAGEAGKESDFGLMGKHAPKPGDEHVSAQGINELRKVITGMGSKAVSPEDRRASAIIKDMFDDKVAEAFENHMLPGGDPNAHAVIRNAVEKTAAFKQKFGYNYRRLGPLARRAASELNQIATGQAGPTDIASKLVGGSPGRNELSHPLYQRILNAVDNPGAVRDRLRGTYWREVNHPTPNTAARKIGDLGDSPMGRELFSPQELEQQRAHGVTKQQTELELRRAQEAEKAAKPKPEKLTPVKFKAEPAPAPGKAEILANKVLGAGRTRGEQEIYGAVDQFAKSDPKNFARTWGRMTEDNRKEFTASWVRELGGGTGEDFNPTKFVKNWDSYSDQAKTIMLNREQRQAFEDFRDILKEYGDNIKKYGNPSGTAQISFYQKLLTGAIKYGSVPLGVGLGSVHPIGALIAGVGARQFANFMAKPEGVQRAARWAKLAKAYQKRPDPTIFKGLSKMTRAINEQASREQQ